MIRLRTRRNHFDTVFVVALLLLLAMTAVVLILIGAKQYQATANQMNTNYEVRTASSYLFEKIRQSDTCGTICVKDFNGSDALVIYEDIDGITYTTYIYYYKGYLCELFVSQNSVYSPASGQKIIEANAFTPSQVSDGLIRADIENTKGDTETLYLSLKSAEREDEES